MPKKNQQCAHEYLINLFGYFLIEFLHDFIMIIIFSFNHIQNIETIF